MVKQDVRLQLFVTPEMNAYIDEMAKDMGLKKNEVIRMAVATYVAQWRKANELVRDIAKDPVVLDRLTQGMQ